MNITQKIACISLAALLASCAPAGYYDSNGEYRAYGKSDSYRYNKPMAGTGAYHTEPATTHAIYTRPGYYDRNGYYIASDSGPSVPTEFLPPRGMCRVWITNIPVSEEPSVESCTGIQDRVPAGAYVIFGG